MIDAFALVDRLSTFSLGGLVALILVCSYFKIWVWGSVVTELKADFERRTLEFDKRLAKEEQAKEKWEAAAVSLMGMADKLAAKSNQS